MEGDLIGKSFSDGTVFTAPRRLCFHKQPVEIAGCTFMMGSRKYQWKLILKSYDLAEAYDLPKLAGEIEAGIRACLDCRLQSKQARMPASISVSPCKFYKKH